MRILNAESLGYSPSARRVIETLGEVVEADLDRTGLLDALRDRADDGTDVLIVRLRNQIDGEVFDAAGPRLHTIVSATTGLDHIDLDETTRRGITVLCLKGETEFLRTITATAEHTWALLLALVRNLPAAAASAVDGDWDRDRFRGTELKGRRLGIVGLGRIGSMVARYGAAFQMTVAAYDPHLDEWPNEVTRVHDLTTLCAQSDVLSVHVPLDATTHGLIGAEQLDALPDGAVIVNTSRGAVLDEARLCDLLQKGRLGGLAADVINDERTSGPTRLLDLARSRTDVLITPHIAGATHESMERTEIFMAEKLIRHLETLTNIAPPEEAHHG